MTADLEDFEATIEMTNRIRRKMVRPSEEHKPIQDIIKNLSNILRDIEDEIEQGQLSDEEMDLLGNRSTACQARLRDTSKTIFLSYQAEYSGKDTLVGQIRQDLAASVEAFENFLDKLKKRDIGIVARHSSLSQPNNDLVSQDQVANRHIEQQHRLRQRAQDPLTWLDASRYDDRRQGDLTQRRLPKSGLWLLQDVEFKSWMKSGQGTLWLRGMPGSGKTFLASTVVEHLCQNEPNARVAYLYCNSRRPQEQKAENLISRLIKQLIRGSVVKHPAVIKLYDHYKESSIRPTYDELSNALLAVLLDQSGSFIIIDGLDEFEGLARTRLLSELSRCQNKAGVRLLAISRFTADLNSAFRGCIKLSMPLTNSDLSRYIEHQVSRLPLFKDDPKALEKAVASVSARSGGMFTMATLLVNRLIFLTINKTVENALELISQTNAMFYKELMSDIYGQPEEKKTLAINALSWIICARRSLTSLELRHALAIPIGLPKLSQNDLPSTSDIRSCCLGLIDVDDKSDIMFVHFSVKAYLQETWIEWLPDLHAAIGEACLTYITFDAFSGGACASEEELDARLHSNCFYDYAAHNWGHHVREGKLQRSSMTLSFMNDRQELSAAAQVLMLHYHGHFCSRESFQTRPVHVAAIFGMFETLSFLLKGQDPTVEDWYGASPLFYAAQFGSVSSVTLLLDRAAAVDIMLAHDKTALVSSSYAKPDDRRVFWIALEKSAKDAKHVHRISTNPFNAAAASGHQVVIEVFLNRGADASASDMQGRTPLHYAAMMNRDSIAKLLLRRGAHMEAQDFSGNTPLQIAFEFRAENVVDLLLKKGAFITGRTPKARKVGLDILHTRCQMESFSVYEVNHTLTDSTTSNIRKMGQASQVQVLDASDDSRMMVQQAMLQRSPRRVFRKCFRGDVEEQALKRLARERMLLEHLRHPNIVSFLGFDIIEEPAEAKSFQLYMEYCELGDISIYVPHPSNSQNSSDEEDEYAEESDDDDTLALSTAARDLTQELAWSIIVDIASALAYCHHGLGLKESDDDEKTYNLIYDWSWPILHRDVKPENIVHTKREGRIIAKLCDFGFGRLKDGEGRSTTDFGDYSVAPPEVLNERRPYTTKADIYGLGVTMSSLAVRPHDKAWKELAAECRNPIPSQRPSSLIVLQVARSKLRPSLSSETYQNSLKLLQLLQPSGYHLSYIEEVICENFHRYLETVEGAIRWKQHNPDSAQFIKRIRLLLTEARLQDIANFSKSDREFLSAVWGKESEKISSGEGKGMDLLAGSAWGVTVADIKASIPPELRRDRMAPSIISEDK